jgi:excisionase family DNA binding protein
MPNLPATRSPALVDDEFLLAEDVALALKVHVTSVYRLIKAGRLTAIRTGGGSHQPRGLRILRSSFERMLNESLVETLGEVA